MSTFPFLAQKHEHSILKAIRQERCLICGCQQSVLWRSLALVLLSGDAQENRLRRIRGRGLLERSACRRQWKRS